MEVKKYEPDLSTKKAILERMISRSKAIIYELKISNDAAEFIGSMELIESNNQEIGNQIKAISVYEKKLEELSKNGSEA